MGIFRAFSSRREGEGGLNLKEYDHSVGFTLKTKDQFSLEIPNNENMPEYSIAGIPFDFSFSTVGDNGSGSTVSSLTTNSTDSSSIDTLEYETSPVNALEDEEEHSFLNVILSNVIPCWYDNSTDPTDKTDWCTSAQVQTSPSDRTDEEEPDSMKNLAGSLFVCGGASSANVETSDSIDTPIPTEPGCYWMPTWCNPQLDKYAVPQEEEADKNKVAKIERKRIKELKKAQRAKRREEKRKQKKKRNNARKNKKEQKTQATVSTENPTEDSPVNTAAAKKRPHRHRKQGFALGRRNKNTRVEVQNS